MFRCVLSSMRWVAPLFVGLVVEADAMFEVRTLYVDLPLEEACRPALLCCGVLPDAVAWAFLCVGLVTLACGPASARPFSAEGRAWLNWSVA